MKQPQPNLLLQLLPDDPAHALRNVAARYGVDPTSILHLAPVLFHVVAQLSLADRRDALKRRADAHSAMSGDGEAFLVHSAGMFPEDRFEERRLLMKAVISVTAPLAQRMSGSRASIRWFGSWLLAARGLSATFA